MTNRLNLFFNKIVDFVMLTSDAQDDQHSRRPRSASPYDRHHREHERRSKRDREGDDSGEYASSERSRKKEKEYYDKIRGKRVVYEVASSNGSHHEVDRRTEESHRRKERRMAERYYDERLQSLELEKNVLEEKYRHLNVQLLAAEKRNKSLEDQLQQSSADFKLVKEHLQRAEAHQMQTTQLLDTRTKELKGAQVFLDKADTLSGADIIEKVEVLNSEIFQAAAFIAESPHIDKHDQAGRKKKVDANEGWMERTGNNVGARLLALIFQSEDPLPLQVAIQALMTSWVSHVTMSWGYLEQKHGEALHSAYFKIRNTEEQAVSGRWRAITLQHFRSSPEAQKAAIKDFMTRLNDILLIAGWSDNSDESQKMQQAFQERAERVLKLTLELKTAITENITSFDIEPTVVKKESVFDPTQMEDAYDDGRKKRTEYVVCTTDLGLKRVTMKRLTDGKLHAQTDMILKPKVILNSTLREAVESHSVTSA